MKRLLVCLAFFVAATPGSLNAYGEISVSLTLNRQEATLSDSIQMVVSVSGAKQCDAPPEIEGLDRFDVTRGGSSSRVEIINGRIRKGIDYTYYLRPSTPGTFQIGPALARVDGETFESNKVSLTIVKGAPSPDGARGPVFLTATLSSQEAYVEEQVLYTLRLYLRTRVSNISLQLPEQDYLTFQQLGKPREYQGMLEGYACQILEVAYAVSALREGDYQIEPARMEMSVYDETRQSGRGPFDDPFFSNPFFRAGRPVSVFSEPLELKIMRLPEKGKPDGFSGLVGSFTIASELTPSKIRAGESTTLTVQVAGRGNVHRIPDLRLPAIDHVKIYADQPVFAASHDLKGLTGSKRMKWALVPELPGDYEIPPLSISFFDPEACEYRTIQTPGHSLAVIPGKGKMILVDAGNRAPGSGKEAVQEIGHDILPLHMSVRDMDAGSWTQNRSLFVWAILLFPALLYGAAFTGQQLKRRSLRTRPIQQARGAARRMIRQCRQIEDGDPTRLSAAVREYVNSRFGLSLASLTPDEAVKILRSHGVGFETAGRLQNALQEMEDAIYAGRPRENVGIAHALPGIIRAIEREIR
ncbi:MAG: protein BatD [Deltaproteobacteria bacterium]|nr:protein BatD [Deltaproteobacteria bacterium]